MATVYPCTTPPEEMMFLRRAWRKGTNEYEVIGRGGKRRYRVLVVRGVPRCECPSGRRERVCYHAGIVLKRLEREGPQLEVLS